MKKIQRDLASNGFPWDLSCKMEIGNWKRDLQIEARKYPEPGLLHCREMEGNISTEQKLMDGLLFDLRLRSFRNQVPQKNFESQGQNHKYQNFSKIPKRESINRRIGNTLKNSTLIKWN